jgi:hypothetical protein
MAKKRRRVQPTRKKQPSRKEGTARLMEGLRRYTDAAFAHGDFFQTARTVHDLHLKGVFGAEVAGSCTVEWPPIKAVLMAVIDPGLYEAIRAGDADEVERITARFAEAPMKSSWWPALEYALAALPVKLDEALQETVAEAILFETLPAEKPSDFDLTARVEELRREGAQSSRDRLRAFTPRAPGRPPAPDLRNRVMSALYDSESQPQVAKALGVSPSTLSKWAASSEFGSWRGVIEYHRRRRSIDFSDAASQQEAEGGGGDVEEPPEGFIN